MNELPENITFEDWIQSIFDQDPDESLCWLSTDEEKEEWNEDANPLIAIEHLTRLFAKPAFLIDRYSRVKIDRGLGYLFSNSNSNYMYLFRNKEIPWEKRIACVDAIEYLYADLMAPVYGNDLGHLDMGDDDNPITACYMWWDIAPIRPSSEGMDKITDRLLQVFAKVLRRSRSEACLESVLHGLGHWSLYIPDQTVPLIERFYKGRTDISPELRAYAREAATGQIL